MLVRFLPFQPTAFYLFFLPYCTAGASAPCSSAPGTGPRFSASSGQGPGQLTATLPLAVVWSLLGLWQEGLLLPAPTPQRACPWLRRLRGPGHCQSPHLPFETRPGLSGPKSPAHVAPSPLPGPARPLLVLSNPRGRLLVAHAPHGSGQQARARAFSASPPLQAQTSTEPETAPFGPVGGQCGTGGGERLDGRFSSRVRVPRTESHCTAEPRRC